MTSALEMRQVSKVYGSGPTEVHALHEINLSVERGEGGGVCVPGDRIAGQILAQAELRGVDVDAHNDLVVFARRGADEA